MNQFIVETSLPNPICRGLYYHINELKHYHRFFLMENHHFQWVNACKCGASEATNITGSWFSCADHTARPSWQTAVDAAFYAVLEVEKPWDLGAFNCFGRTQIWWFMMIYDDLWWLIGFSESSSVFEGFSWVSCRIHHAMLGGST